MSDMLVTEPQTEHKNLRHQHLLMTGVIVRVLRKLFSDPERLPHNLRNRIYTSSPDTQLRIETRGELLKHDWQARPALVVRANSLQTKRMGIGEGRLTEFFPEGVDRHNTLYVASHTVLCLSSMEVESQLLAMEAQQFFNRFQHHIRRPLCLLRLRVSDVGQAGLLKEARQMFASPFTIGYAYDQPYAVYPVGPKVRFLNVQTSFK